MTCLRNLFAALRARAILLGDGFAALFKLVRLIFRALIGGKGPLRDRVLPVLTLPSSQLLAFAVLRAFLPNFVISKRLVTSYDNNGTAVVTRAADVIEVLDREADFAVVYEPKMRAITGGANFFLGMQNTAQYQHDTSLMRLAMRRDDVESVVTPLARRKAEEFASAHQTRIDLPQDLTLRVPAAIVSDYFGTPGPDEQDIIEWATILFWYLFVDLKGEATLEAKALVAAKNLRESIDASVAARKASGEQKDDVLGRALALQAGAPEFDDIAIRDNLIGLVIGAIPTISRASVQAVDQLLDRPEALAGAQAAARAGDENLLGAYVFEALRFNPINPVIYRRANRDATIAASTLRARKIPKGTLVFAANLSAMFDPLHIEAPNEFRVDRPWGDYILWGYGLHTCFGAYINRAVIPAILQPVLARPNLRRAPGSAGQIDGGGTPFPQHFVLESD
ncbi:MAG: cytochrome P450 [Methylocystaceae bacterium]|nr:MAG: cytochrome P450 [Methylocystaceae bacterium]